MWRRLAQEAAVTAALSTDWSNALPLDCTQQHPAKMHPGTAGNPALARLAALQDGVLRKDQLKLVGVSHRYAVRQVTADRWSEWGLSVVLLSNAPPSRSQLKRVALKDVRGLAALASHSALEQAGFRSFADDADLVHVLVVRGATYCHLPGVVHHESRRFGGEDVVGLTGLPATRAARSAIDAGAWQRWPRFAVRCSRPSFSSGWQLRKWPGTSSPWASHLSGLDDRAGVHYTLTTRKRLEVAAGLDETEAAGDIGAVGVRRVGGRVGSGAVEVAERR